MPKSKKSAKPSLSESLARETPCTRHEQWANEATSNPCQVLAGEISLLQIPSRRHCPSESAKSHPDLIDAAWVDTVTMQVLKEIREDLVIVKTVDLSQIVANILIRNDDGILPVETTSRPHNLGYY